MDVIKSEEIIKSKPSVRKRAEAIKPFRCKNLIAVLEPRTSSGIVLYEIAKQRREYQSKYAKRDR